MLENGSLHFEKGAKEKFLVGLHYKKNFNELRDKFRENFNIEPYNKVMECVNKLGCSFDWGKWKVERAIGQLVLEKARGQHGRNVTNAA